MPRRVFTSPIVWAVFSAAIVFGVAMFKFPDWAVVRFLSYALILVSSGLTVGYLPEMWLALKERRYTMLGLYATGAAVLWLAVLVNRTWAEIATVLRASWTATYPVVAIYLFLFLVAGLLQLLAPGVVDGRMPRRNMVRLGMILGGAVAASILMWQLGFDP